MPPILFRKRQRLPNIARQALAERVVPTLHVRCFPGLFANALVRIRRKDGGIGLPKIAETPAAPIFQRKTLPEATAGTLAVIANDEGDHLTSPTTQDRPQPPLPRPLADKRPDFVDL